MYRDFGTVFFATIVAVIFVIVPLVIQWLIAPSNKTKEKLETYECGEVVEGSAWLQFNIRFYVIGCPNGECSAWSNLRTVPCKLCSIESQLLTVKYALGRVFGVSGTSRNPSATFLRIAPGGIEGLVQ